MDGCMVAEHSDLLFRILSLISVVLRAHFGNCARHSCSNTLFYLCQKEIYVARYFPQGRFEILNLTGSYLLAESGDPLNRTGGISISFCSPDGHIIGCAIGGRLIAATQVQIVVFSFVYGGSKAKNRTESNFEDENNTAGQSAELLIPN
ncbi:Hypothetical predicted protein [Olea europaea subsp. europaea]|uniref:AT-hook motif nuclear-localized protein n=1 Tax=Olea europaea subsp. europaea TaxID=158383 RepID=A0A8S0UHY4_OLEEU|nr:Hypothetical predicted protein [Olea europaea subsp. europaea]